MATGRLHSKVAPITGSDSGIGQATATEFAKEGADVSAGHAVLLDVRLLHCSGPNSDQYARIGLNVRYVAPGGVRMRDHTPPNSTRSAGQVGNARNRPRKEKEA